ncbi:MAG: glucose-6-phosphate isomerase [Cellvibrionaceae bacterium]
MDNPSAHSEQLTQRYPSWQALRSHFEQWQDRDLRALFAEDPKRAERFSLEAAGLFLDFSKNLITDETLDIFSQLCREAKLEDAIHAMFSGQAINNTENRPALHTALRNFGPHRCSEEYEIPEVLAKMDQFVNKLHNQQWQGFNDEAITDVVNIGIGGSDLGPRFVVNALKHYHHGPVKVHFVSNIDEADLFNTLDTLNPATTLFIIASKSFTTLETLTNAQTSKQWLMEAGANESDMAKHFVAVSSSAQLAEEFGIKRENIFPMWDWVGGRYSLWSAIGLPIAIALGIDNYNRLRKGAYAMDEHFRKTPTHRNMPTLMALLGIWYQHFWQAKSHCVLPYDHDMQHFPSYLQQLDMESNGKSVSKEGETLDFQTGSIIWGSVGTNGQHSFHQLLLQGNRFLPVDFIAPLKSHRRLNQHHSQLLACCFSQSQALMQGKTTEEVEAELSAGGKTLPEIQALLPHKVIPGNRPSNTLLVEEITPETLGALLALYEHKVYVQSVIWNINAFDQWGVELGKQLGKRIHKSLEGADINELDSSTQQLIARAKKAK